MVWLSVVWVSDNDNKKKKDFRLVNMDADLEFESMYVHQRQSIELVMYAYINN